MSRAIRYTEIYFHQQSFAQIISVAIDLPGLYSFGFEKSNKLLIIL